MQGKILIIFGLIVLQWGTILGQGNGQGGGQGKGKGGSQGQKESTAVSGELSGRILDENSEEAVEFATISLYSTGEEEQLLTGTISDLNGYYLIDNVPAGRYIVKASFIGYKEFVYPEEVQINRNHSKEILKDIYLSSDIQQLEEVAVEAERELMVNSIDKRTFNVAQDATSQGGDATDVLSKLPSVDVDIDGNVSLRGGEGVVILIDGRLSAMTDQDPAAVLDQIPSNSIESVEVITNPSVKYSADGAAGIINIILKKGEAQGTNGSASVTAGTGEKYNAGVGLNRYMGKFNLFGDYNYRNDRLADRSTIFKENRAEDFTSFLNQNSTGFNRKEVNALNLGADFTPDDYNSFTLSGALNINSRFKEETFNTFTTFSDGRPPIEDIRFTSSDVNRSNVGTTFDYHRKFKNPNQRLDGSFGYSNSQESNNAFFGENENNRFESNANLWQGQLDYVQSFSDQLRLEAGWSSRFFRSNEDFQSFIRENPQSVFTPNEGAFFNFNYREDVHAVYGLLAGQLQEDLNYQVGMRVEQVIIRPVLSNPLEKFNNDFLGLFPSLHISKGLGDDGQGGFLSELQLSYSRRFNRPKSRWLNPFVDLSNPQNIKFGNPNLVPEFVDTYELSFLRNWLTTSFLGTLYYKHSQNPIARVFFNDPLLNITENTWENLNRGNTFGAELNLNSQLTDWWNMDANLNYFYFNVDGSNIPGADFSNNGFGWTAKLLSTLDLWKGASMQVSARYTSARNVAGGRIKGFLLSDVALKQRVLDKKGTISLRINDPFNLFRFEIETFDDTFFQNLLRERESQIVYLGFTYNFGQFNTSSPKKSKKKKNKKNREDSIDDMY